MSDHLLPYLANCSLLFTEEPLLRRPAAARAAGFGAVEFWWPFATPVPADREVDAFVAAIEEAGVALVGLNFFAGDLAGPDCGVLSIPGRSGQFRDNVDVVAGIGERLGVRGFNALYGNRIDGVNPDAQDELAAESIGLAAKAVASFGGTVLIEPVSGPKPYPLRTADDAVAVVRRARAAGAANVGFLCDLYHLASNGDDIDAAIAAHAGVVAHVQIADAPGRGEPGSGQLDLDRYLAALADRGYRGWVSLEYKPTGTTEASLAWLPRDRRSSPREPKGRGPPGLRSDGGATREEAGARHERPEASGKIQIGFIGLGIMGAPMAANLVKAGFEVTGYNRSPARVEQLAAAGGRGAASIAEAVRDADVVATMVPDSPDVQEVLAGEDGVFGHARPGALIIDFSSIRPDVAAALAAEGAKRGFRLLDAPVSGGEQGAIEGVLSIMVGGAAEDFEAAAPVFDAVGKTIVHVGPAGSGQTVKAANQLMVAGHLELLAEAIVFLEAYGVDTEAALRVLGGGLAGSTVLQRKGATMLARDFRPGFRIALHDKDMGIVTAAAREAGVVIPLGAVAAQLVASLKAQGDGGLDHSALLKLVMQLSGRQERQE